MRPAFFTTVCAWLVLHAGSVAAGPVRLPDGRMLETIDFDRHFHALLDRQGCNAGKCHGNRDAKGGFALSLLAASPESDFLEITRRGHGRMINTADPDNSLLLLKATGRMTHGGEARILDGSWEYRLVREWIAQGAKRQAGRGQIKNLQVTPHDHILQVGDSVQLKVIAEFVDGATEDVTAFCDFRMPTAPIEAQKKVGEPSTAPVRVSPVGTVVAALSGDVGISVVYRGKLRVMRARVAVPAKKGFVYPDVPEVNFIDREVFGQLRKLNIVPAELTSDEQFLRRVTIDLIGTVPTPAEVRDFAASKDPDRRTKKIDELLADPLHAALLAIRFCEMTGLIGLDVDSPQAPRSKAAQMAHGWFRKRLEENMPYDRIVAGVLTATSREGRSVEAWHAEKAALEKTVTGFDAAYARRSTLDIYWRDAGPNPPTLERFDVPARPQRSRPDAVNADYLEGIAERTASAFLGVNLECARCHDHPLEGWTPTDYRAFANLFGWVGLEKVTLKKGGRQTWDQAAFVREVFVSGTPVQLTQPNLNERTFLAALTHGRAIDGAALPPRLLCGPTVDLDGDPREQLVRWLADAANPFFARRFVSLIWEHYFGVSLLESTDRFTSALPSANHALLDRLAKEFIDSKFDIRRLERTILLSRTYQLSHVTNHSNKHDRTNFARAVPRRVDARLAIGLVHRALDTSANHGPGLPPGLHPNEVAHLTSAFLGAGYDDGYRDRIAVLVRRFGRGELVSRCDNEPDLRAMLHYYGSSEIQGLLTGSKRIQRLGKADAKLDAVIDEAFLATVSRMPTPTERKTATEYLEREWPRSRQHALENLFWALINWGEFTGRR